AAQPLELLTRAEVAALLRISVRQVDRLRLPRTILAGSRSPRFRRADIERAIAGAVVAPADLEESEGHRPVSLGKPVVLTPLFVRTARGARKPARSAQAEERARWCLMMREALGLHPTRQP